MVARPVVAISAVATSMVAAKVASRWLDPKSLIRWGSRHAFAGAVVRTGMRVGDPFASLCGGVLGAGPGGHERWGPAVHAHVERRRACAVPAAGDGGFTVRAVAGLAGRIEEMAVELLDTMERRGDVGDLVAEYAELLPVLVIAEILGVPPWMRHTFLQWAHPIVPLTDLGIGYPRFRRAEASLRELNDWLQGHFERLRREPGADLLSSIVVAAQEEADGTGMDEVGLMVNSSLLLLAGFETTVNLIGNGSVLLMSHPEQLAKLQADPAGWANAVDEVLRFDSPVQHTVRYPPHDTAVRGIPIRRGQFIILLTGGANRDPAVFDDPHTFDMRRGNARDHLSFSAGPHFCVGAALARLEGKVGLRLLFERFPGLSLAGELRRRPTRVARGVRGHPRRSRHPARRGTRGGQAALRVTSGPGRKVAPP